MVGLSFFCGVDKRDYAVFLWEAGIVEVRLSGPGFVWASGRSSPIYMDHRRLLGEVRWRRWAVHALLELVEPLGPLGGVVGVATAGIPWAAWIGEALDLPVGYVRAQPKSHGLGKQVEGLKLPAQDLLVVEDLLSTGGSVERAIAALEAAGGSPKAVAVLWSYELPEAKALPYPVQALLTFSEALGYWEEAGFLSRREADRLRVWHTYGTLP